MNKRCTKCKEKLESFRVQEYDSEHKGKRLGIFAGYEELVITHTLFFCDNPKCERFGVIVVCILREETKQ